jgi:lactobin A/cerein 7B family class IIb bacteriocin
LSRRINLQRHHCGSDPHTVTQITSHNGAASKFLLQPAHGEPVEHWRIAMNMPIAETKDTDLYILTDNELDDVNGGFIWFVAAGAYLVGVGAVAGYYATKAIIKAL